MAPDWQLSGFVMVHNIKLTVTITVIFLHVIQLNTNAAQEDKFGKLFILTVIRCYDHEIFTSI